MEKSYINRQPSINVNYYYKLFLSYPSSYQEQQSNKFLVNSWFSQITGSLQRYSKAYKSPEKGKTQKRAYHECYGERQTRTEGACRERQAAEASVFSACSEQLVGRGKITDKLLDHLKSFR